jgi:hypothetical protein
MGALQWVSRGLLLGVNEAKFKVLDYHLGQYTITVHLKNKLDDYTWAFTKRIVFWDELRELRTT